MKKHLLSILIFFLCVPLFGQVYRNPIISGFHPDPSVCRVGDTFYLVNSSFQYFPGVPIFQSKDLIHWQQIGNVLDRESQVQLKGASSWQGIYAPTIRYHDGTYYMITTNVGNGGNFMVTATNPRGPWSEPIWLKQQGIDPSLYFENGKCYMVSNPDNTIMLCEINPSTGEQLTESKALWQGTGGRYPEGPHIYKKDGWYYLLISEGGTELAHRLTIARSKKIDGPYQANPDNPILTHCSLAGQSNMIQGTGHGDLVQAVDGRWWMVFLAYRNFGGSYHHLGRETFLAPVKWDKGAWPVVNGGNPVDTMMNVGSRNFDGGRKLKEDVEMMKDDVLRDTQYASKEGESTSSLRTSSSSLGETPHPSNLIPPSSFSWLYLQNPLMANYELHDGVLRLHPHGTLAENERPTFKGVRQEDARMTVETEVRMVNGVEMPLRAGLSVYQINDGYLNFCVENNSVVLRMKLKSVDYVVGQAPLSGKMESVKLRIQSDGEKYVFAYSTDGNTYQQVGSMDCTLLSTEVAGGFTGVIIGMFVEGSHSDSAADFMYFKYVPEK